MKVKAIDVYKKDSLLVEFLKNHRGEENLVSGGEIVKFMEENGYKVNRVGVGVLVNRVMYQRNAPICFTNGKGYYWAKNRAEIEKTIADLDSRRSSLQEHIDHLKGFIID